MAHSSSRRLKLAGVAAAFVLVGAVLVANPARAQTSPTEDIFAVNYYTLAHTTAPDALMRIVNPTSGTLCAMTYVFDQKQVLNECCGCPVTHNGLLQLSVNKNLTSRPAVDRLLVNGVIKVVSASPSPAGALLCDPTSVGPTAALREWITHPQILSATSSGLTFALTEEEFADSPLSEEELVTELGDQCRTIRSSKSAKGLCICPHGG